MMVPVVRRSLTRASLLLLALAWVLVRPLAAAIPTDPTWIAGVYDNADLDDAVLLAAGLVGIGAEPGLVETGGDRRGRPLCRPRPTWPASVTLLSLLDRSPPGA